MKRTALFGILLLFLNGCLASGSGIRTINSTPPGATVMIAGFGECETPCDVKLDENRSMTVAKAGYLPQNFWVAPKGPPVEVILQLAAPTDAVDTETLPEL